MIDFFSELKTVGLTALFNPTFLVLLVVLFFLGKLVGWMTRNINVWKFLAVAYFGIFLFRPLQEAGLIIGGVFILGVASMYMDLFRGIFGWAGGFGDVVSAFRSRGAYEDIRRLEREIEALRSQLRASQIRPNATSYNTGQTSTFGSEPSGNASPDSRLYSTQNSQAEQVSSARSACLLDLGLDPNRPYELSEIKAAWRRMAFETHPDRGGSEVEFSKIKRAWTYLSREAQNG